MAVLDEDAAKTTSGESETSQGLADEQVEDRIGDLESRNEASGRGSSGLSSRAANSVGNKITQAAKSGGSKSKWKMIAGIGGSLGLLFSILVIFFLLMLFKNIHIKNLFMDYEFAKFNRSFTSRLNKAIDDAGSSGTSETNVSSEASPIEQLDGVNAAEVDKIKTDEAARARANAEIETLDQSLSGTGGDVASPEDLDLSRNVADEAGKPADVIKTDTENSIREETNKGAAKELPTEELKNVAKETEQGVAENKPPDVAVNDAIAKTKFGETAGDFAKDYGVVILTLACIGRDIYKQAADTFAKLKLGSLAQTATTTAKYADCQKENKCNLTQISTVAGQFDNGKESFTQTAAYQRAAGQPVTGPDLEDAKKISPQLIPGDLGKIINIAADVRGEQEFCSVLLNPQVNFAANAIAIGVKIGTSDIGVGEVVTALEGAAAIAIGSQVVKALAIDAVMHYGNLMFAGKQSPIQMGNAMGAGSKALAADTCRTDGCHQLTPEQNQNIQAAINADREVQYSKQSLAYKMLSPHNPYSTMGLVVDHLPTTPGAVTARLSQFMASIFNFNLFATKSRLALNQLFHPMNALAANGVTVESNTYGIPDYGFTDEELNRWSIRDNAQYVDSHKADFDKFYAKCMKSNFGAALTKPDAECSANDEQHQRFHIYALDRRVTHDLVLRYNKQTGNTRNGSSSPAAAGAAITGPVYLLGDSISNRASQSGLDAQMTTANHPITINADDGRSITSGGMSKHTSGLQAIASDTAAISAAQAIIIELGTNGGLTADSINSVITPIRAVNQNAKIFWVNVGSIGYPADRVNYTASANAANAVLASQASTLNYTVIDWCSAVFGNKPCVITPTLPANGFLDRTDGVHPSVPTGIGAFNNLLVGALGGAK
jgi:hypothetical protein